MNQVDNILVSSTTSHEALKRLYGYQKQKQPSFSLTILGKKLSISSKGHVSDMIRGRRSISRKHWSILSQVFELSETQTHYFHCLLEKDHSKCQDQRSYHEKQLESLEKLIDQSIDHRTLPVRDGPTRLAVDLLKAFPIFNDRPNFRDILDYFGRHRFKEIQSTLGYLMDQEYIEVNDGCYSLKKNQLESESEPDIEYLKASYLEACEYLNRTDLKQDSLFTSDVVCLSSENYKALMKELGEKIDQISKSQNTGNEDTVVKINLQVYPLGSRSSLS